MIRQRMLASGVFCLLFLLFAPFAYGQNHNKTAVLLKVDGVIGPATQDYVHRGIEYAREKNAQLIILQLDTPGGLDKSMRGIIKAILRSAVPVVTYVAPSGARAASAGTYILYASHIAAMAPGTNLGAATPVQIGGNTPLAGGNSDKNKKDNPPSGQDAMKAKATNDAVAYIQSLAKLRDRNARWAEKAIREAASLPAHEALEINVIDLEAKNMPELLAKLDGHPVEVAGKTMILNTKNMAIKQINPDWRTRFLAVITDPSIAYILLLIGIYGLFFEFANPGFIVPGIVGAICLLMALYAFQLLPINYAGLALIILGLAFLAAEAFMPSFGALGIGGIIAFIAGSILLMDTHFEGYNIHWGLIIATAIINAAFFIGVIGMAIKARRHKIISGSEELVGMLAIAIDDFDHEGWVRVHSERWRAKAQRPIKKGQHVKVARVEGLLLHIKPVDNNALEIK